MSSLKGDFMDAQNIVIINDVPHFSMKGNTYLEKLKNGLSLDYVFFMEDSVILQPEYKFEKNVESFVEDYKQSQPFKHELFAEEYDYDVMQMPRKGKKIIKKRSDKNLKKNKVKQNGYNDKMRTIEINQPEAINYRRDMSNYFSLNELYLDELYLDELYNARRSSRGWD